VFFLCSCLQKEGGAVARELVPEMHKRGINARFLPQVLRHVSPGATECRSVLALLLFCCVLVNRFLCPCGT
jgi:hypothetical protein